MKIYALSDIHLDYKDNIDWLLKLASIDFKGDRLILADDISDSPILIEQRFRELSKRFKKVLFTTENHDLWTLNLPHQTSLEKYNIILKLAKDNDMTMDVIHIDSLSIAALLSWYDYSFAHPCQAPMDILTKYETPQKHYSVSTSIKTSSIPHEMGHFEKLLQ